jgi:hypothetical protein
MKTNQDLAALLKAADPVSREPGLSQSETARMRQAVLHAHGESEPRVSNWLRMSAAGAVAALLVIAGTIFDLEMTPTQRLPEKQKAGVAGSDEVGERRQVQFATPGGTRIIWTLNPEFKVGGLAP